VDSVNRSKDGGRVWWGALVVVSSSSRHKLLRVGIWTSWHRPLFDGEQPRHQQPPKQPSGESKSPNPALRGRIMSDLPTRPPALAPPLPAGWTEHKAPSGSLSCAASLDHCLRSLGHTYYYNKDTKKSTYTRPTADIPQFQAPAPSLGPSSLNQPLNGTYNEQPPQTSFNPQPRRVPWRSQQFSRQEERT
jgi:hypothetical protein